MNRVLVGVPLVLAACGEPAGAPELLLPEDVRVAWEDAYNGVDDGLGALVPIDVMVYDSASGAPLVDVSLQVWTDTLAAWALPVESVVLVAPDEVEGEWAEWDQMLAWDATRDRFVAFDTGDGLQDGVTLRTDVDGIARLYVFVDAFPAEEGLLGPIRATVSMMGGEASVEALIVVAPW